MTPPTSSSRTPLRILICESNELNALKLRRLLELRGHVPRVVTLDEALALVDAHACDRLLIDSNLVAAHPECFEGTSVIALTSSSAPAAGHLSKPVLAAELWAALDD